MYLKLAFRNAKKSMIDYLLYILSVILLLSFIFASNFIANLGHMQAGFQTIALPLVIVLIMIILVNYMNFFLIRQRAKEFATYLLLGMEKNRLAWMYLCELWIISLLCFALSILVGLFGCRIFLNSLLRGIATRTVAPIILKSIVQTAIYFIIVEMVSIVCMKKKIYCLQINQLMHEKKRNQPFHANRKGVWGWITIGSFLCFWILVCFITFMSEAIANFSISIVSVPMLCSIIAFYKWAYAVLSSKRLAKSDNLYVGNRLYWIAEMTTNANTNAILNAIFCTCLLFSAASFIFGTILLNDDIHIWSVEQQQWMGFLQISICVIFMIIYFSVQAMLQIVAFRKQKQYIHTLRYLGKSQDELSRLLRNQILVNLFFPTCICFLMLWSVMPVVNYKMNLILPTSMRHSTLLGAAFFTTCYLVLHLMYFSIIKIMVKNKKKI